MDAERLSQLNRARAKLSWKNRIEADEIYIREHEKGNEHLRARLNGYLCGDGSVMLRRERGQYERGDISFYPDHLSLIAPYSECLDVLYNKKPNIAKKHNYYQVRVSSICAVRHILSEGIFTAKGWRVPEWVMQNKWCSREWLRAFYDCEGYVGQRRIHLQCVNKKGMDQIREMLGGFDIETRKYVYERKNKNWNTNYHLGIFKKESRYNFLNTIGLNHKEKLRKLVAQFADVA